MNNIFYLLSDPTQNVPEGDKSWISSLKENETVCSECGNFLKRHIIDIFLNEKIRKNDAPITYARGTNIGMIRFDIVSIIGIHLLEEVYHVGKVFEPGNKISDTYISLVPKEKGTFIRGGTESKCRSCEKCGTILYFPLPFGKWYLTKESITNDLLFPSYFMSDPIVHENIFNILKKSGIKKIGKEKLLVKENAVDGYDVFFEAFYNNGNIPD